MLRNDVYPLHHWLKVKLVGKKSNRSAIGGRVTLKYGRRVCNAQTRAGQQSTKLCTTKLSDLDRANLQVCAHRLKLGFLVI